MDICFSSSNLVLLYLWPWMDAQNNTVQRSFLSCGNYYFFSLLHSDKTVLKNNFIWNKCSVMKCPKWTWIIHPGSLELGFLERIFCQRFLKSCLVTEITWALTQARNCKTHSLWAALWKLSCWGVPPSNTCDAGAVMKLRVTLACGSSHGADKCWPASRRANRKTFLDREAMRGLPIRVDRQHLHPAVPLLQIRDGGLVSVVWRDWGGYRGGAAGTRWHGLIECVDEWVT